MNKIPCPLIQDLLPLVVDGIAQEATIQTVQEHLSDCEACQKEYEQLKQKLVLPQNTDVRCESAHMLLEMKRHLLWKRIAIAVSSVLVTCVVVVSGYMVFENVGMVHNFFAPHIYTRIRNNQTNDWQALQFDVTFNGAEQTNTLNFDNIFYTKQVVNDANSDAAIDLRVLDTEGNIVLDEIQIQPGTAQSLDELKRNTEYHLEVKTTGEDVFLNFF